MIKVVEHGTPEERAVQDAFFNWQEKGYTSAWASLVALKLGITAYTLKAVAREFVYAPELEQQEFLDRALETIAARISGTKEPRFDVVLQSDHTQQVKALVDLLREYGGSDYPHKQCEEKHEYQVWVQDGNGQRMTTSISDTRCDLCKRTDELLKGAQ